MGAAPYGARWCRMFKFCLQVANNFEVQNGLLPASNPSSARSVSCRFTSACSMVGFTPYQALNQCCEVQKTCWNWFALVKPCLFAVEPTARAGLTLMGSNEAALVSDVTLT